jgi:hypothetical protein
MNYPFAVSVLSLAIVTSMLGQGTAPRTPGRVGGSPNNPSVERPTNKSQRRLAATPQSCGLTPDEQKKYDVVTKNLPVLSCTYFFEIEYLSDNTKTDIGKLSHEITRTKTTEKGQDIYHIVEALEKLGLSEEQAKALYSQAQAHAHARLEAPER